VTDTEAVVAARRRVADAIHAMHVDQDIRIDERLARELDAAWEDYDAAIIAAAIVDQP
jgi:hypothetical protein